RRFDGHAVHENIQALDIVTQAFGNSIRRRQVGFGQYNGKLLSTISSDNVRPPHRLLDSPAYGNQNPISRRMAIGVINLLKMINVENDQGEFPLISFRPFE